MGYMYILHVILGYVICLLLLLFTQTYGQQSLVYVWLKMKTSNRNSVRYVVRYNDDIELRITYIPPICIILKLEQTV